MMRTRTVVAGAIAAGALLVPAVAAHAATEYRLTIVKSPVVSFNQKASLNTINDDGVAAGSAFFPGSISTSPALVKDGALTLLPAPGDPTDAHSFGNAFAINRSGQVAGTNADETQLPVVPTRPFVWDDGVGRDLGVFNTFDARDTEARAINDAGHVAGFTRAPGNTGWLLRDGVLTRVGTLPGGTQSAAFGINQDDVVVGDANLADPNVVHAFSWRAGAVTDLGALPGGTFSAASDVNAAGTAVGVSTFDGGTPFAGARHAVMFSGGRVTDLRFPREADGSRSTDFANAINDQGTIVGTGAVLSIYKPRVTHAIRWRDGQAVDLNALIPADSGFVLKTANDINSTGQIVGAAIRPDNTSVTFGYILTPIS
jgi:probable HAF family extracellular repeat protein